MQVLIFDVVNGSRIRISACCAKAGIECVCAASFADFATSVRHANADIVVARGWGPPLDLASLKCVLPSPPPPLLLYALEPRSPNEIAQALDAGADDVVVEVYEREVEMFARLRSLARGPREAPDEIIWVASIEVDVGATQVRVDGADVGATPDNFRIMLHLARSSEPISCEALGRLLGYGTGPAARHAVAEAVRRTRLKLGLAAPHLATVPDGYQLVSRLRTTRSLSVTSRARQRRMRSLAGM